MKWVGLTGGIATGKTTVAGMLRHAGYPVVDADQLAREVVAPGSPGLAKVVEKFGKIILLESGELDRKKIGKLVFDDTEKRLQLERILHPLIQTKVEAARLELEKLGQEVAFYDVPLLYEKNMADQFDAVVVVACSAPKQMERLIKRDGLGRSEASARVSSQLPIMEKAALADYVIWNDGSEKDLSFQVVNFLEKIPELKHFSTSEN